ETSSKNGEAPKPLPAHPVEESRASHPAASPPDTPTAARPSSPPHIHPPSRNRSTMSPRSSHTFPQNVRKDTPSQGDRTVTGHGSRQFRVAYRANFRTLP